MGKPTSFFSVILPTNVALCLSVCLSAHPSCISAEAALRVQENTRRVINSSLVWDKLGQKGHSLSPSLFPGCSPRVTHPACLFCSFPRQEKEQMTTDQGVLQTECISESRATHKMPLSRLLSSDLTGGFTHPGSYLDQTLSPPLGSTWDTVRNVSGAGCGGAC